MLNNEQLYTYNILMAGYNVFLTGDAGTGKTYTLMKFIEDARAKGRNVVVTAPTGIAAENLDGVTLHRTFCAPIGVLKKKDKAYDGIPDVILNADIIIVDEISMCRIDLFDFISNKIIKANEHRKIKGYNSIQLVVAGDFFQLPPVITSVDKYILDKEYKRDIGAGFAFDSVYWDLFNFKNIILTQVERQGNKEFIYNLNKIRTGQKGYINYFLENCAKTEIDGAITLCGTNEEANSINNSRIKALPGEESTYKSIIDGDVSDKECIASTFLNVKIGTRVMMLVNSKDFKNGSFGYITNLYTNSIEVKLDNGSLCNIERYTWEIYDYEVDSSSGIEKIKKVVAGHVTQFPLKPAYAVTIHKSQGQTYDCMNLSPYCWDCGQLYVALSRVRDVKNLYLKYEADMKYLVVSLNVIAFFNKIVKDANGYVDTSVDLLEKKEKIYSKDANLDSDMKSILNRLKF